MQIGTAPKSNHAREQDKEKMTAEAFTLSQKAEQPWDALSSTSGKARERVGAVPEELHGNLKPKN